MRVHEDVEAILSCCSQHSNCVLYPLLVVLLRSLMLYSFPSEDISDSVVAEFLKASEMDVCILQRKRALVEVDMITVEEVGRDMRRDFRCAWVFGIAGHVNTADRHLSSIGVLEVAILDSESQRHGGGTGGVYEASRYSFRVY